MQLACRIDGPGSVYIILNDADNATESDEVYLDAISDSYQKFTIPLSSFTGMSLNDIGEIAVGLSGVQSGSGVFCIDDIRLKPLVSAVKDHKTQKPSEFNLCQNYPNPYSHITEISYHIPFKSKVKITLYDVSGKEVKTLVDETKSQGNYRVKVDGSNLASGIYYYQLRTGKYTLVKKMALIK